MNPQGEFVITRANEFEIQARFCRVRFNNAPKDATKICRIAMRQLLPLPISDIVMVRINTADTAIGE